MSPTEDDNGAEILNYELWIDDGDNLLSTFHNISSYDGLSSTFVLIKGTGLLGSTGTTYRVKYRAKTVDY